MNGADEAISRLLQKFEVYILSTAPWKNVSSFTDKRVWVEKNLPSLPLLLSYNKSLMRGRFLIDDRPKNGAKEFGQHDGQVDTFWFRRFSRLGKGSNLNVRYIVLLHVI